MTTETDDAGDRAERLNANLAKLEQLSQRLVAALARRKMRAPAGVRPTSRWRRSCNEATRSHRPRSSSPFSTRSTVTLSNAKALARLDWSIPGRCWTTHSTPYCAGVKARSAQARSKIDVEIWCALRKRKPGRW